MLTEDGLNTCSSRAFSMSTGVIIEMERGRLLARVLDISSRMQERYVAVTRTRDAREYSAANCSWKWPGLRTRAFRKPGGGTTSPRGPRNPSSWNLIGGQSDWLPWARCEGEIALTAGDLDAAETFFSRR